MIASHDSLTGYKLKNWWLYPLISIAKTQTKTIEEQLDHGVKYFDLRFRKVGEKLYAAHGILIFDITLEDVINKLDMWALENDEDVYFRILLEDALVKDMDIVQFKKYVDLKLCFASKRLKLHCIGQKSKWNEIEYRMNIPFLGKNDFKLGEIDEKIEEMENFMPPIEPYIYECYSYKILIPKLSHLLIKKSIIENSMRNFI